MTTTTPVQRAFSSGEISPALYFRPDYLRFQTGLRAARGFLPMLEGGITRAPGTVFRGFTRANLKPKLISFQFSTDDALVLEFTPGKMRVWRYGALIETDGVPYELVTPFDADDLARLSWVQSADVIYIADGTRPIQRLARYALDNWTISDAVFVGPFMSQNIDETITLKASASTGTITLTASSALFLSGHVGAPFHIRAAHFTDIPLWTGNTSMKIGQLVRYDAQIYRLVRPAVVNDPPEPGDDDPEDIYTIGTNSYCRVGTESVNTNVNPPIHQSGTQKVSVSPDVYWEYVSGYDGIVRITDVISPTSAIAEVLSALPPNMARDPSYRWSEGAWSDVRGYPACVEIYEQRFVAAATPSEPRTTWFSVIGDYADHSPGVNADDAFAYAISGQSSLNRIQGMKAGSKALHIFALGQEFSSRSDNSGGILTPATVTFRMDSAYGAMRGAVIAPDGDPIFITRDQRQVVQISYDFQSDGNQAANLSRAAQHLGADAFGEICWQSSPQRFAWVRRASGDLVAMLHDPSEEVLGWSVLPVADGRIVALAVTPSIETGTDIVTIAVEREIDGSTVCMIEDISDIHAFLSGAVGPFAANHFYSAVEIASPEGTDTVSAPHLVGQEVYAWTDGGEFGPLTVAETGLVELPAPATVGFVGLFDDTHYAQTLDIVAASKVGDTTGSKRRIKPGVGVAVLRTAQGYLRAVEHDLPENDRLRERRPILPLSVVSDLTQQFTGVLNVDVTSGGAKATSLRIEPHFGAPLTILTLSPTMEVTK